MNAGHLKVGQQVARMTLSTVQGSPVVVPDDRRLVHLQLRRFAGCPVCNLHLHDFASRVAELHRASIREVIVFHSTREALQPFVGSIPFDVIPDPQKRLYAAFGAETSPCALLASAVWPTVLRAVWRSLGRVLRHGEPLPSLIPEGGRYGLPADFLITPRGTVAALKYGRHADDQWSVDELLAIRHGSGLHLDFERSVRSGQEQAEMNNEESAWER